MNIPQIQLQTTRGQIALTTQKPVQQIEQPKADLDLQQPKAEMSIHTTKSELSIDSVEMRESLDLRSSASRAAEVAQYSAQTAMEGLARRSQEGGELMKIENGGNPLVEQAKRTGRQPYSSLGIKFIPQADSVKINFTPGSVDIQAEPQKVINNTKTNKPIHNYTPGKVNVDIQQHPSLKIDWLI
ncbi:hypothetical protein JOC25_001323 [Solibacillus kalamii]|uniref:Uncharacterized protein n=1 Tax=Solibacillus kalamii TaxID=1748298 RepID=A0ABX3ZLW5_9BACL|nr:DUF6470 family protein [Solibacillus kalamii]MBM7664864.1 hypothetical protein [Solibacillus kalamii]OUZ40763.1 hypothetical protein CBM15_02515 [Solibacillus kalamii]